MSLQWLHQFWTFWSDQCRNAGLGGWGRVWLDKFINFDLATYHEVNSIDIAEILLEKLLISRELQTLHVVVHLLNRASFSILKDPEVPEELNCQLDLLSLRLPYDLIVIWARKSSKLRTFISTDNSGSPILIFDQWSFSKTTALFVYRSFLKQKYLQLRLLIRIDQLFNCCQNSVLHLRHYFLESFRVFFSLKSIFYISWVAKLEPLEFLIY